MTSSKYKEVSGKQQKLTDMFSNILQSRNSFSSQQNGNNSDKSSNNTEKIHDLQMPVTLELFMKYTYYEEVIDTILLARSKGDKNKYQELKNNEKIRANSIRNYYQAFYLKPKIREKCPIRFKPMPCKLKEKFLRIPNKKSVNQSFTLEKKKATAVSAEKLEKENLLSKAKVDVALDDVNIECEETETDCTRVYNVGASDRLADKRLLIDEDSNSKILQMKRSRTVELQNNLLKHNELNCERDNDINMHIEVNGHPNGNIELADKVDINILEDRVLPSILPNCKSTLIQEYTSLDNDCIFCHFSLQDFVECTNIINIFKCNKDIYYFYVKYLSKQLSYNEMANITIRLQQVEILKNYSNICDDCRRTHKLNEILSANNLEKINHAGTDNLNTDNAECNDVVMEQTLKETELCEIASDNSVRIEFVKQYKVNLINLVSSNWHVQKDLPIDYSTFKKCTVYEKTMSEIISAVASEDELVIEMIKNDTELYNYMVKDFYLKYFTDIEFRKCYPLKLKLCPANIRKKMSAFIENKTNLFVRENSSNDILPCVTKANKNVESQINLIQPNISKHMIDNDGTELALRKSRYCGIFTDEFLLNYIRRQCTDLSKQHIILERIKMEYPEITEPANKDHLKTIESLNEAFADDKNEETTENNEECEGVCIDYVEEVEITEVENEHVHDEQLIEESININISDVVIQNEHNVDNKVDNKVENFDKISETIVKGNSVKESLFQAVDRSHTLLHILRTRYGLKQDIIRVVLNLSFGEFEQLTHIYEGEDIKADHTFMMRLYDYVMGGLKVWPPNLYINLEDLIKYLQRKCMKNELPHIRFNGDDWNTLLQYISPKFLHWSDLCVKTNFVECVTKDFFKRTAKILNKDDEFTLREQYISYYNQCWMLDEWITQTPQINSNILFEINKGIEKTNEFNIIPDNCIVTNQEETVVTCIADINNRQSSLHRNELQNSEHFVIVANTQQQIDMLSSESITDRDPLHQTIPLINITDEDVSHMIEENSQDKFNVVKIQPIEGNTLKKEPEPMLNGVEFYMDDSNDDVILCRPLIDDPIILNDTSLDLDVNTDSTTYEYVEPINPIDNNLMQNMTNITNTERFDLPQKSSCDGAEIINNQDSQEITVISKNPTTIHNQSINNNFSLVSNLNLPKSSETTILLPTNLKKITGNQIETNATPINIFKNANIIEGETTTNTYKGKEQQGNLSKGTKNTVQLIFNRRDFVPQLTHQFRPLPVKIVGKPINFQIKRIQSIKPNENMKIDPSTSVHISQELANDCTIFNSSTLLKALTDDNDLKQATQNAISSKDKKYKIVCTRNTITNQPESITSSINLDKNNPNKVKVNISDENYINNNFQNMLATPVKPALIVPSKVITTRNKIILYRKILRFDYFQKLNAEDIAQFELPTIAYGTTYIGAVIACDNMKFRICDRSLSALFPTWSSSLKRDVFNVLNDLKRYSFSAYDSKTERLNEVDVRVRALNFLFETTPPFSLAFITYNPANAEYSYCEKIGEYNNNFYKSSPYKCLTEALSSKILTKIREFNFLLNEK